MAQRLGWTLLQWQPETSERPSLHVQAPTFSRPTPDHCTQRRTYHACTGEHVGASAVGAGVSRITPACGHGLKTVATWPRARKPPRRQRLTCRQSRSQRSHGTDSEHRIFNCLHGAHAMRVEDSTLAECGVCTCRESTTVASIAARRSWFCVRVWFQCFSAGCQRAAGALGNSVTFRAVSDAPQCGPERAQIGPRIACHALSLYCKSSGSGPTF